MMDKKTPSFESPVLDGTAPSPATQIHQTPDRDILGTNPFDDDKLHEECGVFGIYNHPEAAAHTVLGLHALQHRGQEAAGIGANGKLA